MYIFQVRSRTTIIVLKLKGENQQSDYTLRAFQMYQIHQTEPIKGIAPNISQYILVILYGLPIRIIRFLVSAFRVSSEMLISGPIVGKMYIQKNCTS